MFDNICEIHLGEPCVSGKVGFSETRNNSNNMQAREYIYQVLRPSHSRPKA